MKEYWLLLDAYVFLWSNPEKVLIYNTLSGKGVVCKKTKDTEPIVREFENKSNLYCTGIRESDLQSPDVRNFITLLRENFCGDILDKSIFPQKPIVVIPELNVNEDILTDSKTERDAKEHSRSARNLQELTIYLTGECDGQCVCCGQNHKQLTWCCRQEHVLSDKQLMKWLNGVKYTSVGKVGFLGGDVFSYPDIDRFMAGLTVFPFKKVFYSNVRFLPTDPKRLTIFEKPDFELWILADFQKDGKEYLYKCLTERSGFNYLFKITSIEEYETACSLTEKYNLNSQIIPFFTGDNVSFFEENIFQNSDDILNSVWSKKNIFAHTVINTNYFGKFTITSSGNVYSDINASPIGSIYSDTINDLVTLELKNGQSWCRTRDKVLPCMNCLYKYLCPSPSNYETAIGRFNLCKELTFL